MLKYLSSEMAALSGVAVGFLLCAAIVMVLLVVERRTEMRRRDAFYKPFGDA